MRATARHVLVCVGVVIVVAAGALLHLTPARAASAGAPTIGACYSISDAQARADWWPVTSPVPCAGPHTLEITHSGPVPADVDALRFAKQQCSPDIVWRDLGVNQAASGVVVNPLRIQIVYFAVRSSPGDWACGISGFAFHGRRPASIVPMTGAWAEQSSQERARWRMCASATRGRPATAPPITVPCTTTPRWQAKRWIQWNDLLRSYPGQRAITQQARRICGAGATFQVPSAKEWQAGSRSTFCVRKFA